MLPRFLLPVAARHVRAAPSSAATIEAIKKQAAGL